MTFTFKMQGFERLDRELARLAKPDTKSKRAALKAGGEIIAEEARRLVPVKSGNLRASIKVDVTSINYARKELGVAGTSVLIGPRQGRNEKNDGFYGHMIEFGTEHSAAHPFMRPAWDARRGEAEAVVISMLTEAMLRSLKP